MSQTVVLEPHERLVDRVAELVGSDLLECARSAVVFPGKRPAHFVRKALGQRFGKSFIPPRIFSIEEFIEYLAGCLQDRPAKLLSPLDAASLLWEVHESLEERLGGNHFATFESFVPLGLKLVRELEELKIANLPYRKIQDSLRPLTIDRLHVLPEYYREFYERVVSRGFTTRAMRYVAVADGIHSLDLSEFRQVVVVDYLALTKSEQRVVGEMKKRDHVMFLAQREGDDTWTEHGPAETEQTGHGSRKETEIWFHAASDIHGQVFALASRLAEQRREASLIDERTVVVLPTSEALFPLLRHALGSLKWEEYNIAMGYPLSRTPVLGFIRRLLAFLDSKQEGRFPVSTYLGCMLHPYAKNIRFGKRSDVTRMLMHIIENALGTGAAKRSVTLEEIESNGTVFDTLAADLRASGVNVSADDLRRHLKEIHARLFRPFDRLRDIADLSKKLEHVLLFIHDASTAHLHPLFRQFMEAAVELLLEVGSSLAGAKAFEHVAAYRNFLSTCAELREVPFAGTPLKGLQVLGLLETRTLQFDTVHVLCANDDVLPGTQSQDVLLPQRLRESLGLESRRGRERVMQHYFNVLLRGANTVHIYYAENGDRVRSRFVEQLVWSQERHKGIDSIDAKKDAVRYAMKLGGALPEPVSKSDEIAAALKRLAFSASALDTYLRCPLRFYYRHVLQLQPRDEPSVDVDPADVGSLVHAILKRYFERFVGKRLAPDMLRRAELDQVVDEVCEQVLGAEPSGKSLILPARIKKHLQEFVDGYQKALAQRHRITILAVEEFVTAEKFGVLCEGRLDRVERRDERTVILDYKTGMDVSNLGIDFKRLDPDDRGTWDRAVGSLQLPMYLLLYSERHGVGVEEIASAYVVLGRQGLGEDVEVKLDEDDAQHPARFKTLETMIGRLVGEILDPSIPFHRTGDPDRQCPACPYKVMCGTQWIRSWRNP